MLVIALVGKRGSGKNLAADYIARQLQCRVLDYTADLLAPLLKKQKKAVTRANLIALGMRLRQEGGNAAPTRLLLDRRPAGQYVISGIRFPEEVAYLRQRFGDCFHLLAITAPGRQRYERSRQRGTKGEGALTYQEFLSLDKRPTEAVIPETMALADAEIANSGTPDELFARLDQFIKQIGKGHAGGKPERGASH